MKDFDIALLIRMIIYPVGALVASRISFVRWDDAAGLLIVDVNAASAAMAIGITAAITGGTFAWSRIRKRNGGAT